MLHTFISSYAISQTERPNLKSREDKEIRPQKIIQIARQLPPIAKKTKEKIKNKNNSQTHTRLKGGRKY